MQPQGVCTRRSPAGSAIIPAVSSTPARAAVLGAVDQILAIPAATLPLEIDWREARIEFRHGIFQLVQVLEEAQARVRPQSAVAVLAGQLSAARWTLRGALLPFEDADLETVPGPGEWTPRQTLAHVLDAQEWWAWILAFWAGRREHDEELGWPPSRDIPRRFRLDVDLPRSGSIAELLGEFDTFVDRSCRSLACLDPALDRMVRWNRTNVRLGFYPLRATQHLREHTLQLDKTLAMFGREPTEQQRIARVLLEAFGRLEGPYLVREAAGLASTLAEFKSESKALFANSPA